MTLEARRRSVLCASPKGLHRMAYLEWGDARNPRALVCVHGLTRCGRDFDELARAMAQDYRVVCPDVAGRGDSDWLPDPSLYTFAQYVSDMVTLVARLDVAEVHWVGTSMGGIIGMALAAHKNAPVARLVLNDAGAVVSRAALERIAQYVGLAPDFASIEEAEKYVRAVSAPFGPHSDAQWRFLTEVVVRRNADGGYRMNYDPLLADAFRASMPAGDLDLWTLYDAIRCPTLVMRGESSDLLTRETSVQMAQRGPRPRIVEIPGVGHAPTLLHAEQIDVVREFLLAA
jgi:pimeloyl-ACP methyl ester carboxylesterase